MSREFIVCLLPVVYVAVRPSYNLPPLPPLPSSLPAPIPPEPLKSGDTARSRRSDDGAAGAFSDRDSDLSDDDSDDDLDDDQVRSREIDFVRNCVCSLVHASLCDVLTALIFSS